MGRGLLSEGDYRTLSAAMQCRQKIVLTRTLGDTEVTASVLHAGRAWPVAMLVQVRVRRGGMEWVQNFESVEAVVRSVGQKQVPVVGIY